MISCIIHTKSLLFSSSISNSNVTCSVSGSVHCFSHKPLSYPYYLVTYNKIHLSFAKYMCCCFPNMISISKHHNPNYDDCSMLSTPSIFPKESHITKLTLHLYANIKCVPTYITYMLILNVHQHITQLISINSIHMLLRIFV